MDFGFVKDCVLAAVKLGSGRGGVFRYKTRVHKILFLLAQEFEELRDLRGDFIPHHFGPWSYEVEFAVRALVRLGFLEEKLEEHSEIDGLPHAAYAYAYRLTRAGRALAGPAVKRLSPKIKKKMKELLKLDLWTLIGYVKHPEYASRSVFADVELVPKAAELRRLREP